MDFFNQAPANKVIEFDKQSFTKQIPPPRTDKETKKEKNAYIKRETNEYINKV